MKEMLKTGKPVIGVTITVGNPDVGLALAASGFDFFWFEMEHTPPTLESVHNMILATRGLKTVPLIRVPCNEPCLVKGALDAGSLGVIFPFTNTRALAEQAVRACKYPPLGVRGFGPERALLHWNRDSDNYIQFANENILVIVMIEQEEAVRNIEEIASVPGIDVLFVGPYDMSFSFNVGGQPGHPRVEEAILKVLAAAKKNNLVVGYPAASPEEINKRVRQGFRIFLVDSDLDLMQWGARALLSKIEGRKISPPKPGTLY